MEGVRQGSGFTVKVDPPGLPACLESKERENAVWFIGPSLSNCKSWNRLGRLCFSSAGLLEAYKQHTLVHPVVEAGKPKIKPPADLVSGVRVGASSSAMAISLCSSLVA